MTWLGERVRRASPGADVARRRWRSWRRRPARMSSTSSVPAVRARHVRTVTAAGRTLRVAVRPGTDPAVPPLLLMNGIGASLEVLQPFVDALDRPAHRDPVRRPGVGGSPRPVVPYNLVTFSPVVAGMLTRLGFDGPVDVLGLSWGGGLAQHFAVQHRRRVPPAGARGHRHRLADGAGPPAGAGPDAHPAPAPRPGLRAAASPGRSTAARCAPTPSARPGRCTPPPGSALGAATTTSWPRARAGAACRSCG